MGRWHPQPTLYGVRIARSRNPLLNPCPTCGAQRYERCFRWTGISGVQFNEQERAEGYSENGRFLDVLPEVHSDRVPSKVTDNENEGAE